MQACAQRMRSCSARPQDEKLNLSLGELIHTTRGAFTVSFAVLSLVAMAVFVYIEVSGYLEEPAMRGR